MSKDVQYGEVAVADSMPSGGGRKSPLYGLVDAIVADEDKWRSARCIAHYAEKTAAGGAADVLRGKFGRKIEDGGLEFAVRKVNVRDAEGDVHERHGLWVYYDPDKIVPGQMDAHVANEKAKAKRANDKAKAKKMEKEAQAA